MDRAASDNPYWDDVEPHIRETEWPYHGGLQIGGFSLQQMRDFDYASLLDRYQFVPKYSWTVTDPASVKFVAKHSGAGLFDPMAGTGYWAYVLGQVGVDVICYDLDPHENQWHGGGGLYTDIKAMDCAESAALHPDRTMLLSWPPYGTDVGARALKAYGGNKVIYMGEGQGGCTGSDRMFNLFSKGWKEVACHRPVQWWGVRDRITVYERAKK